MRNSVRYVDIPDSPDLARLAEEVRAHRAPCVLRRSAEDLAVVLPLKRRKSKRSRRRGEIFLSSAGSWTDVDGEKLLRDIYARRDTSTRPPAER